MDWDKILSYLSSYRKKYIPPTFKVSRSSGLVWKLMVDWVNQWEYIVIQISDIFQYKRLYFNLSNHHNPFISDLPTHNIPDNSRRHFNENVAVTFKRTKLLKTIHATKSREWMASSLTTTTLISGAPSFQNFLWCEHIFINIPV